ncbi:ABC transporter substrate-binding protein [Methylovirgula sp. 4M-Z18]|uniref:ABC transporter substrate-binding protein n=1 Tax=Methylovirgula sp. 4M-Z18 TaxID=2293567 RepID=UPI001314147C|nr:ABC transporter substrate-binding protein [Methylovirgula sp. 4M-Z18]
MSDDDFVRLSDRHPDLIVDYGDVNADYAHLADMVQDKLHVPYLLLDGSLTHQPDMVRKLGAILGKSERAETIAAASQQALGRLQALAPAERIKVYYARGVDGLQAVRAGSSLSEAIELAGAQNVTPAGHGAFMTVSLDDVVRFAPQVVILADSTAATFDSPLRRALPEGTRFLIDRGLPYPILEKPPSINRLVGALALAEQLYPKEAHGFAERAAELQTLLFPGAPQSALFLAK